jgi:hypothetical protein
MLNHSLRGTDKLSVSSQLAPTDLKPRPIPCGRARSPTMPAPKRDTDQYLVKRSKLGLDFE